MATHRGLWVVHREVAHHPGVSHLVFLSWGIGEGADVRAEHSLSLGRRPHSLVKLVKDDGVLCQSLEDCG